MSSLSDRFHQLKAAQAPAMSPAEQDAADQEQDVVMGETRAEIHRLISNTDVAELTGRLVTAHSVLDHDRSLLEGVSLNTNASWKSGVMTATMLGGLWQHGQDFSEHASIQKAVQRTERSVLPVDELYVRDVELHIDYPINLVPRHTTEIIRERAHLMFGVTDTDDPDGPVQVVTYPFVLPRTAPEHYIEALGLGPDADHKLFEVISETVATRPSIPAERYLWRRVRARARVLGELEFAQDVVRSKRDTLAGTVTSAEVAVTTSNPEAWRMLGKVVGAMLNIEPELNYAGIHPAYKKKLGMDTD